MWRAPEGPEGLAAVPVGGGGAWPDNEPTHKHTSAHQRAISGQTGILPRGKRVVKRAGDGLAGSQCPEASKSNSAIEE